MLQLDHDLSFNNWNPAVNLTSLSDVRSTSCVYLNGVDGYWVLEQCGQLLGSVCEAEAYQETGLSSHVYVSEVLRESCHY